MASKDPDAGERPHISNFSSQRREDRYPDPDGKYAHTNAQNVFLGAEEDYTEFWHAETWNGPPYVAIYRNNLVALSQKHNLYFVASRDAIHVFVPRNLKQIIPTQPDLILEPPRSPYSYLIGGYINEDVPHSINHMIVGNLGDLEILLIACDDGDIIAYYTHLIQKEIENLNNYLRVRDITPFFQQTAGQSAWGLAIHTQSRLIAYSCNNNVVTVFGLAYTEEPNTELDPDEASTCKALSTSDDETHRKENFRIVVKIPAPATNIPTICFESRPDGEASKIIAGDIHGRAWMADLTNTNQIQSLGMCPAGGYSDFRGGERSWGILSLARENFKIVKSAVEAWNRPESKGWLCIEHATQPPQPYIHVTLGKPDLIDQPHLAENSETDLSTVEEKISELPQKREEHTLILDDSHELAGLFDDDNQVDGLSEYNARLSASGQLVDFNNAIQASASGLRTVPAGVPSPVLGKSSTTIMHAGEKYHSFPDHQQITGGYQQHNEKEFQKYFHIWLFCFLRIFKEYQPDCIFPFRRSLHDAYQPQNPEKHNIFKAVPVDNPQSPLILLRTYAQDIELVQPLCDDGQGQLPTRLIRPALHVGQDAIRRFNLICPILELNIVLCGAQSGRVVILTLAQLLDPNGFQEPFYTFRQEGMLPLDDHLVPHVPTCPLLGITASPVHGSGGDDSRRITGRKWRVILHYYDHTILSYDLGWSGRELLRFGENGCVAG